MVSFWWPHLMRARALWMLIRDETRESMWEEKMTWVSKVTLSMQCLFSRGSRDDNFNIEYGRDWYILYYIYIQSILQFFLNFFVYLLCFLYFYFLTSGTAFFLFIILRMSISMRMLRKCGCEYSIHHWSVAPSLRHSIYIKQKIFTSLFT